MEDKKVLIVDDEEPLCDALAKFFTVPGVQCLRAHTIEDAEYAINHTSFDLVLADIRLTGVVSREGLELLAYIKERAPATEVFIMTAYGDPEMEEEAYEKGAGHFFHKPLELSVLHKKAQALGIPTLAVHRKSV